MKKLLKSVLCMAVLVSPLYAEKAVNKDPLAQCYESTQSITVNVKEAIRTCLTAKLTEATEHLDYAYTQVQADLEEIDSAGTPAAVKALDQSRTAFVEFRDTECERQSTAMMGGTGSGNVLLSCQIQLNDWRSKQLLNR